MSAGAQEPAAVSDKIWNGIVLPSFITLTQQELDELKNFPLRPDDLFIVTYPKSGTTWLQQIVKLIRSNGKDDSKTVDVAIPWILDVKSGTSSHLLDVDAMPSPRAFKAHMPYQMMPGGIPSTSLAKYIYVARNPKDVCTSLYYQLQNMKPINFTGKWDDVFQLFMTDRLYFGSWFDHVLEWWKHRDCPNVLFLKYEDMKKDPRGAVRAIAAFMGCDLKPEVVDSIAEQTTFEKMRSNDAANYSWWPPVVAPNGIPFMRKGVVGDWRNHFTAEQSERFDALYAEKMKGSGLELDFDG